MSDKRAMEAGAVSFSERLASSQLFVALFRDGMALVDDTASYLDGSGRLESKKLERSAGLVYATESLRLNTLRYQAGEATILELVDAQTALIQARNAYDDGMVRYRLAIANLQTLTGNF